MVGVQGSRLQGIYSNAAFTDNQFLIDWINSQHLVNPLICLGDGHSGVWKLTSELATPQTQPDFGLVSFGRKPLQSWGFALCASSKLNLNLWRGEIARAIALFTDCRHQQAHKFITYLNKHRSRIITGVTQLE